MFSVPDDGRVRRGGARPPVHALLPGAVCSQLPFFFYFFLGEGMLGWCALVAVVELLCFVGWVAGCCVQAVSCFFLGREGGVVLWL